MYAMSVKKRSCAQQTCASVALHAQTPDCFAYQLTLSSYRRAALIFKGKLC